MELKPKDRIPHDPLSQIVPRGTIYLRAQEAAQYCRCGRQRLHRWEDRGLLEKVVDPDGRRFYRVEDLDRVMVGGTAPTEAKEVHPPPRAIVSPRPAGTTELPYTKPRTRTRKRSQDNMKGGRWPA